MILPLLAPALLALAQTGSAAPPAPPAPSGPSPAAPVVVVRLEGPLAESWSSILRRAVETGHAEGAQGLVLELDTPGGEIELMKRLGEILDRAGSDMQTVCWVDRHALSAGSYLAMSCSQLWMAPGATIGAAMPIMAGPGGLMPQLDKGVEEKFLSAFRAEFRSWAELHERDPRVAEAFVDSQVELKRVSLGGETRVVSGKEYQDLLEKGETPRFLETLCAAGELLTLTPEQATPLGYCDGVAASETELLAALGWQDAPLLLIRPNWSESLVGVIGSYSWLLLLAAAFLLVVSFNMPGLGAPEFLAAVVLGLFLFHNYLIGLAEWTDIILVVSGLALILVEIFLMPGTIVPGALGGVFLFLGLLLAMQDFVLPSGGIQLDVFRHNLTVLLLILLGAPLIGMFLMRRFTHTRAGSFLSSSPSADFAGSVTGRGAILPAGRVEAGARGRALTPLRPAGRVEIDGEPHDARSSGAFLPAGVAVRVLEQRGATLLVTALPPEEDDS